MKRMSIAVNDCWRWLRNRSTGRDTELQASNNVVDYQTINISIVSFNSFKLNETIDITAPTSTEKALEGSTIDGEEGWDSIHQVHEEG